jgi:nicotinate-nucleotide adenylyltransferase
VRLGIFGGTFDPIHTGHLVLAEQCREQCQLDEVWFVPAALPPHKQDAVISPAKTRCEMIEFAISGNPQFKLSRIELERSGPSYTVATLEQLHAEDPTRELFLLVGADSIRDLPTWYQPQRIMELAAIVAVNRGRDSLGKAESQPPLTDPIARLIADRVRFVQMPGIDISATDIRQRVSQGRSIRYLVPRAVEAYIREHGFYSKPASSHHG